VLASIRAEAAQPSKSKLSYGKRYPCTAHTQRVFAIAKEEAQRFNHNYLGTEHLLLGLIREQDSGAAKVLASVGIELNRTRSAVEFIIGRGERIVLGDIDLTKRAKELIERAMVEARGFNENYIATYHLLLGITKSGEGIAAGVLESYGVNLNTVASNLVEILKSRHDAD
jgi:ATP-dependent Clp protease ATP-binding subunit ClpC